MERDALRVLLNDNACRVPQFGNSVGSNAEAREQRVIVDREEREGGLQRHGVEFEPHCAWHQRTLRLCSSPARRCARAWSSGILVGSTCGKGCGEPARRYASPAKPWSDTILSVTGFHSSTWPVSSCTTSVRVLSTNLYIVVFSFVDFIGAGSAE
jgi:hypothetical protein